MEYENSSMKKTIKKKEEKFQPCVGREYRKLILLRFIEKKFSSRVVFRRIKEVEDREKADFVS